MAAKDWSKIYQKYKGMWVALKEDEVTVVGAGSTSKAESMPSYLEPPAAFKTPTSTRSNSPSALAPLALGSPSCRRLNRTASQVNAASSHSSLSRSTSQMSRSSFGRTLTEGRPEIAPAGTAPAGQQRSWLAHSAWPNVAL